MKEATGELNITVIAVVAIAAVGALFYAFIWPRINSSIKNNTRCADAVCDDECYKTGGTCECTYIDDKGDPQKVTCNVKKVDQN